MVPVSHKDTGFRSLFFGFFTKPNYKIQAVAIERLAVTLVAKVYIREYGGPFEQTHVLSIVPLVIVVKKQNLFASAFHSQFVLCN